MPFAQWGYPHQPGSKEKLANQFPADFISEALDQTRGWFYSLLAESTLLFGDEKSTDAQRPFHAWPHPFRNCIVLGLMLGEDGQKMSKSKRNYREPDEIFDRYGADALRWYFFANQAPWTSIRYNEQAIKDSIPEFLLRLWNVYSFFVIYANIDGFDPAASLKGTVEQLTSGELSRAPTCRPVAQRAELDRWILSELNRTLAAVIERMDAYDNFAACGRITEFVDALSNWYVRRSRDRFWSENKTDPGKLDAYWTLYECLVTTAKLIAPFVPYLAEAIWQNVAAAIFTNAAADVDRKSPAAAPPHPDPLPRGERGSLRPSGLQPAASGLRESVHLCDFPQSDAGVIDEDMSERMSLAREIVSLGRSARMGAKLKVRQPLAKVEVILAGRQHQAWLQEHSGLIAEELNVKQVEFTEHAEHYISYTVLPDLKRLGPRLGKQLPELRKALAAADAGALLARLEAEKQVLLRLSEGEVTLDAQDVQIRLQAKEGWAAAQGPSCVVVLSTELDESLVAEGLARELVHAIQTARKEHGCEYTDRIVVGIVTDGAAARAAAVRFVEYIRQETLSVRITFEPLTDVQPIDVKIGASQVALYIQVVRQ
jgi:isoleucyl-tRNA synthetase